MAADMDIHAVAGLLKKYFRQLPEPLFTDLLYTSFIQGFSEFPQFLLCGQQPVTALCLHTGTYQVDELMHNVGARFSVYCMTGLS